jgi:hypothetical protein
MKHMAEFVQVTFKLPEIDGAAGRISRLIDTL